MGRRRHSSGPPRPRDEALGPVRIEALAEPGLGLARVEGKAVFIEGALPGESVRYARRRSKPSYDEAVIAELLEPSPQRVTPACAAFGRCGGCIAQHQAPDDQILHKQTLLLDKLRQIGGVQPQTLYPPLRSAPFGYRQKARLGVRYVPKKGGVLVGFRERGSALIAQTEACAVLDPRVEALREPLCALIAQFAAPDRLPQIEVAATDSEVALTLRHLEDLPAADRERLADFAACHGVRIFLQPAGPDSVHPLPPNSDRPLAYRLPDFDLELEFGPLDFTQVNLALNRDMVAQAMRLLDPQPGERIADLFCGIGNFSLPLARRGARVLGLEGDDALVRRAQTNAARNGLAEQAQFQTCDLFAVDGASLGAFGAFDALLLDPPRSGAREICEHIAVLNPERILYVSCNPATLARDLGILCAAGYQLLGAGVMDMFPHTGHVESIALLHRERTP